RAPAVAAGGRLGQGGGAFRVHGLSNCRHAWFSSIGLARTARHAIAERGEIAPFRGRRTESNTTAWGNITDPKPLVGASPQNRIQPNGNAVPFMAFSSRVCTYHLYLKTALTPNYGIHRILPAQASHRHGSTIAATDII